MSRGFIDDGRVQVSVFGGYSDARGDAAKNSMSLLNAIQEVGVTLALVHFCVGRFNTTTTKDNKSTAILKGIAIDLKTSTMFPAAYNWGQFSDFKTQIEDSFRRKTGNQNIMDTEEAHKTADSTFKPKSLRNKANYKKLLDESTSGGTNLNDESPDKKRHTNPLSSPADVFNVKLKPTTINYKTSTLKKKAAEFMKYRKK